MNKNQNENRDSVMNDWSRPDTSKNGLMKKHQLQLQHAAVEQRAKLVLSRLNKSKPAK